MLRLSVAKLVALLKAHAFGAVERRELATEIGFRGLDEPSVVACEVGNDILYRPVACGTWLDHALFTNFGHQGIPLSPRRAHLSEQVRLGHVVVHERSPPKYRLESAQYGFRVGQPSLAIAAPRTGRTHIERLP